MGKKHQQNVNGRNGRFCHLLSCSGFLRTHRTGICCVYFNVCFHLHALAGHIVLMEEKILGVGVASYALMAAGGDLGASVSPQLLGIIADHSDLQTGMLVCAISPIVGIFLMIGIARFFKRQENRNS